MTSKGGRTRAASRDDIVHDEMRTSPGVSIRDRAAARENISTKSMESEGLQIVGRKRKVTSAILGSDRPVRRRTEVDRFTPYSETGNKRVRVATALACSVAMGDMFTMLAVDSITK
jgi:hypothetical protein